MESITEESLTDKDPVMLTDPVKVCVLVRLFPNTLEPELYTTEELTVCTTRVCAVIVPFTRAFDAVMLCLTTKLSAEEAVKAFDEVTAWKAFVAELAVKA